MIRHFDIFRIAEPEVRAAKTMLSLAKKAKDLPAEGAEPPAEVSPAD